MTIITFSRSRIRDNIPISRRQLPRSAAKAPISIGGNGDNWVFGVRLDDPGTAFYEATRRPHQAWIETSDNFHKIDDTEDAPARSGDFIYIYVQLRWIGSEKPALTAHFYRREGSKWAWRSYCAYTINLRGSSRLISSLGCPLPWTAPDDTGARVWIETSDPVAPDERGWFTAKGLQPLGRSTIAPRWHAPLRLG
jgi:hypothetical protein